MLPDSIYLSSLSTTENQRIHGRRTEFVVEFNHENVRKQAAENDEREFFNVCFTTTVDSLEFESKKKSFELEKDSNYGIRIRKILTGFELERFNCMSSLLFVCFLSI